jgi:hypothetical protein
MKINQLALRKYLATTRWAARKFSIWAAILALNPSSVVVILPTAAAQCDTMHYLLAGGECARAINYLKADAVHVRAVSSL